MARKCWITDGILCICWQYHCKFRRLTKAGRPTSEHKVAKEGKKEDSVCWWSWWRAGVMLSTSRTTWVTSWHQIMKIRRRWCNIGYFLLGNKKMLTGASEEIGYSRCRAQSCLVFSNRIENTDVHSDNADRVELIFSKPYIPWFLLELLTWECFPFLLFSPHLFVQLN